jgi:hypothetical protein
MVGVGEGRMQRRRSAAVWAAILAPFCLAPFCLADIAHADNFDLKGEAADVTIATEAATPDGALKASSQVLIRPHFSPDLDTRVALSLATGGRRRRAGLGRGQFPAAAQLEPRRDRPAGGVDGAVGRQAADRRERGTAQPGLPGTQQLRFAPDERG